MSINFKDFIGDVKKGAGIVKRSYADVGKNIKGIVKDKKAKKVSKKKAKAKYGELIDTSSKKEFIKNNGEVNYNKAMDSGSIFNPNQRKLNKIRKAKEAKYSRLK